jgi:hypothetical protein
MLHAINWHPHDQFLIKRKHITPMQTATRLCSEHGSMQGLITLLYIIMHNYASTKAITANQALKITANQALKR